MQEDSKGIKVKRVRVCRISFFIVNHIGIEKNGEVFSKKEGLQANLTSRKGQV